MDKDRIVGAAKQAKGVIKVAAGKALGDAKLTAEGALPEVCAQWDMKSAVGGWLSIACVAPPRMNSTILDRP